MYATTDCSRFGLHHVNGKESDMIHRSRTITARERGLVMLVALALVANSTSAQAQDSTRLRPPPAAAVRPVTDDYFGTKVVDNYRYMENLNDPEVQAWFKNQDAYTRATLAGIPGRDKLLARIRELFTSNLATSVIDVQRLPGDRYFYQKLLPGESVPKLYLRKGLSGAERLLVDPGKVEVDTRECRARDGTPLRTSTSRRMAGTWPWGSRPAGPRTIPRSTSSTWRPVMKPAT